MRLRATGRARGAVDGAQEGAPDATPGVGGVDEEQERLAVFGRAAVQPRTRPARSAETNSAIGGAWSATTWARSRGANIGFWASSPRHGGEAGRARATAAGGDRPPGRRRGGTVAPG